MNYNIINSGSDGNATIIEDYILLDCGVSYKRLEKYVDNLKIVLLTHIHGDHFNKKTIVKLSWNNPKIRFGCCDWLVDELIKCGVDKRNIDVYKIGKKYNYGSLSIVPLKLYHDVPQCGYRLFFNKKRVIYMTDTSTLEGISAKGYDLYLVESNYDEKELEQREVPDFLKERVRNTHLSNNQFNQFINDNANKNSIYELMHRHKER